MRNILACGPKSNRAPLDLDAKRFPLLMALRHQRAKAGFGLGSEDEQTDS